MKKFPWTQLIFGSVGLVVLVVARTAVTIGKSIYYGYEWYVDAVEDPWFYVGMVAAVVGIVSLVGMAVQRRKNSRIME